MQKIARKRGGCYDELAVIKNRLRKIYINIFLGCKDLFVVGGVVYGV